MIATLLNFHLRAELKLVDAFDLDMNVDEKLEHLLKLMGNDKMM